MPTSCHATADVPVTARDSASVASRVAAAGRGTATHASLRASCSRETGTLEPGLWHASTRDQQLQRCLLCVLALRPRSKGVDRLRGLPDGYHEDCQIPGADLLVLQACSPHQQWPRVQWGRLVLVIRARSKTLTPPSESPRFWESGRCALCLPRYIMGYATCFPIYNSPKIVLSHRASV